MAWSLASSVILTAGVANRAPKAPPIIILNGLPALPSGPMRIRDVLALVLFAVAIVATAVTIAVVVGHSRGSRGGISAQQERSLLKLCRNPGNGGC